MTISGPVDMVSPDITTDGVLKKRWLTIKGEQSLLKGGSAPFHQEPLNEVFASILMERLGIACAAYRLTWVESKPCSICPSFVTSNTDYISAHHIGRLLLKETGQSKYEHYLACCESLGIPGVERQLGQMLTVDFLLANEDRHPGNFGALRDADTLQWIGPAPVYDSGASLWYRSSLYSDDIAADSPCKTI